MKKQSIATRVLTIFALFLLFCLVTHPYVNAAETKSVGSQLEKEFINVIKKVKPSVVDISTETTIVRQRQQPFGFNDPFFEQFFGRSPFGEALPPERQKLQTRGSGVIVRKDGYILTNNHVVDNLGKITVTLSGGQTKEATIIGTDKSTDLAVIKIDGDNYPAAELGDSEGLEVGQIVFTFGSPFTFSGSVSQGIISGLGRELGLSALESLIQTDAAMNPGNSGGPLANLNGEVIGINKAIAVEGAKQSAGVGFAIPINLARSVMGDLIKSGKWTRGYLGIQPADMDEGKAKYLNLPDTKGVLVGKVLEKSPAETAGLQAYDFIIEFNGKRIESFPELAKAVALTKVGEKVPVKVIRDGKERIFMVTVVERTEDIEEAAAGKDSYSKWGLTVQTLTEDMAKQKNMDFGIGGLLVSDIDPNSDFYDLNLRKDDVIIEVDKKAVKNIKEYREIIKDKKAGDKILYRAQTPQSQSKIILFSVPESKSK